jgi:hypothetical protein
MTAVSGDVAAAPTLAVDVRCAAEIVGANQSDIRRWIASGLLPCVRFPSVRRPGEPSRKILVAVSDLQRFVRRYRDVAPEPNAALSRAAIRRWARKTKRAP